MIEIELDRRTSLGSHRITAGTVRRWFGEWIGRLDGKEAAVRRENDRSDRPVGDEKGPLGKGFAPRQVGERGEGRKCVPDAQHELAVAQVPEVLAVVVE